MLRFKYSLTALTLAATLPLTALAAGTATLQQGASNATFSWLDSSTARMDTSDAGEYTVLRDGGLYMVNTNPKGGMPPVMEMGDVGKDMVQAFADDEDNPFGTVESVKATGKTETVAGIKGDVYALTVTNAKGKTETSEVVLTGDALVVEMTRAFVGMSTAMVGPEAMAQFMDQLPADKRGLLRKDNDVVLQSISSEKPAADAFELPAAPVNFADLMKQIMEQAQQRQ